MIVRVGFLDKDENYIARLANYYSAHANETVQFEIYLFTKEEALRKQLSRGGRMDLLVAEEDLLPEPEEYSRNMELAFWSTEKHEQKRNGYPVVFRTRRPARSSGNFRAWRQNAAMEHRALRCRRMDRSFCLSMEQVVQAAAQRQRAVRRQWRHRGKIRSASH